MPVREAVSYPEAAVGDGSCGRPRLEPVSTREPSAGAAQATASGGTAPRAPGYDIVIPTIGRPCLGALLNSLARAEELAAGEIILVDDRGPRHGPNPGLPAPPPGLAGQMRTVASGGRGPAAARNTGWQLSRAEWVVFLDDDVLVTPSWAVELARDLAQAEAPVGGVQGRLRVPVPNDRAPTDWERNVQGLEHARWATADLAYRRSVLHDLGGFDERFPRAYREDADLGLRVTAAGYQILTGQRLILHPVRPAGRWVSVRLQRGNADDALMAALHGPGWRRQAGVPAGRRPRHLAITAAGVTALAGAALGRSRLGLAGLAIWALGTAELAAARIVPGPRTAQELTTMILTSAALPPAATGHWLAGLVRARRLTRPGRARAVPRPATRPGVAI